MMDKLNLPNVIDAVMFIGVLCQLGGTASGCDEKLSYTFNGKTVTLSQTKIIFKNQNLKKGLRKCARSNAYTTYEMCLALDIHGNLSKKIQRLNPEASFNKSQLVWLSDFQVDSPYIPNDLRTLTRRSFSERKTKEGPRRKGRN